MDASPSEPAPARQDDRRLFGVPLSRLFGASSYKAYDRERAVLERHRIPIGPLPARHHAHAATLTESSDGALVAAWFAGTREDAPDVCIWSSRKEPGRAWSEPVVVDDGVRELDAGHAELATWNPVAFTDPRSGRLYLWFKVSGIGRRGYRHWWGAVRTSEEGGRSWSARQWLPEVSVEEHPVLAPYGGRACGPVKNRPIVLPDGDLLCGASTETSRFGWRVHFERYKAGDWTGTQHGVELIGPLEGKGIQPSFLRLGEDGQDLLALTRDDGCTRSLDGGRTWSPLERSPVRTAKGLHAETTRAGVHFLAFNDTGSRTPLKLARSFDGLRWEVLLPRLEAAGRKSMDYPTLMEAEDGRLHVVHTFGRDFIQHLVLDGEYLAGREA